MEGPTLDNVILFHDGGVKKINGKQVLMASYWDAGYVTLDVSEPGVNRRQLLRGARPLDRARVADRRSTQRSGEEAILVLQRGSAFDPDDDIDADGDINNDADDACFPGRRWPTPRRLARMLCSWSTATGERHRRGRRGVLRLRWVSAGRRDRHPVRHARGVPPDVQRCARFGAPTTMTSKGRRGAPSARRWRARAVPQSDKAGRERTAHV